VSIDTKEFSNVSMRRSVSVASLGIVAFTPAYGGEEMKMWKDLLLLGAKFFLIVGGIFTWYHRSNDI
jgi:hypothetical protein